MAVSRGGDRACVCEEGEEQRGEVRHGVGKPGRRSRASLVGGRKESGAEPGSCAPGEAGVLGLQRGSSRRVAAGPMRPRRSPAESGRDSGGRARAELGAGEVGLDAAD